jgi:CRP-like cAMP-binding protein
MLAEMPIFADLSPQQIEHLFARLERYRVPAGRTIIKQGAARHHFFVIAAGEVQKRVRTEDGQERIVARLGKGEHFGEAALYTDQPYDATYVCATEVRLLALDEFTFDRLVATTQQMSHYVEQVSSGRLKDTRKKLGLRS